MCFMRTVFPLPEPPRTTVVVPGIIWVLVFTLFPLLYSLRMSVVQSYLGLPERFVGLANYLRAFGDYQFWTALQVTVILCVYADNLLDIEARAAQLQAMYQPNEYMLARPTGGSTQLEQGSWALLPLAIVLAVTVLICLAVAGRYDGAVQVAARCLPRSSRRPTNRIGSEPSA